MQFTETLPSPVGVCVLPPRPRNAARTVSYGHYLHEILTHAGLCYQTIPSDTLEQILPDVRVLVTVGDTALPETTIDALSRWVEGGGMWLAIGGTAGAPALFGVREESATYSGWGASMGTLGEGYLLNTLSSVFLGGTSVFGGTGTVYGTFVASFIVGAINAGIVAVGLSGFWTQLIYGLIIVLSVILQTVVGKKLG